MVGITRTLDIRLNLAKALILSVMLCAVMALGFVFPGQAQALSTSFSIPVRQVFEAPYGATTPGEFNYILTPLNSSNPMPAGTLGDSFRFTLTGNQELNLGPITFTSPGFYRYEIRTGEGRSGNYHIDETVYVVTIAVRNANPMGSGLNASIQSVVVDSGPNAGEKINQEIVFNPDYTFVLAATPAALATVSKTVQGNPGTDYTFSFRLRAANAENPMPAGSTGSMQTVSITGSGQASFGPWTYSAPGVFVYTVEEIDSGNANYVFDSTVYTITDTVTIEDGELVVSRRITNDAGNLVDTMIFINTYVGESDPPIPPATVPGTTTPVRGPKTGDYANPARLLAVMALSIVVVGFSLAFITVDRRGEKELSALGAA